MRCRRQPLPVAAFAALLIPALTVATGCDRSVAGDAAYTMRVDTLGDTIVVRSERGGVWGGAVTLREELRIGELEGRDEFVFGRVDAVAVAPDGPIYVLDAQVPTVRVFDRYGSHLYSFGRRGGGPGEIERPTGLALLPDGRVLISDPPNARVSVYTAEGEPLDSWRMNGGFFTGEQVRVTRDGRAFVVAMFSEPGNDDWQTGLMRVGPEGTTPDSLRAPTWPYEPASLTAVRQQGENRAMSRTSVPFSPQQSWALHPDGYLVGALATRYAIEAFRSDGSILRMERVTEPVPVSAGERAHEEHRVTTMLRNTDPNWRWSGPAIPSTKPPFRSIRTDDDGRIWVRVSVPGEVIPVDERPDPRPGTPPGPEPWREPLVYDVFDGDGRFLGTVRPPPRFTLLGARGADVWGTIRDEFDVQYVVLLRIEGLDRVS